MVKGMGGKVIDGERGLFRVRRGNRLGVGVIDGAVLGEELGGAVTDVMGVREAEVEEKVEAEDDELDEIVVGVVYYLVRAYFRKHHHETSFTTEE